MSTISSSPPSPSVPITASERVRTLILTALIGAFLGAAAVATAYAWRPGLVLQMDRSLPRRFASGLYDSERAGRATFAWTAQRADLKLAEINRRIPWTCSVSVRGGRSDPATQPSVTLAADGVVATTVKATNEFQDATIVLPPRRLSGAVVTLTSSTTIIPGGSDPRQLGVQINRIACAPSGGVAWPPSATIRDAALVAAMFGVAFVLSGLTFRAALALTAIVAALQALPLSAGPAPYLPFSQTMIWFAIGVCLALSALVAILDRLRSARLEQAARVALAVSAVIFYLKLLGLLHPSKLVIDAVFHAHRLEWVLAGRYYFTQPMPSGVTFPYAIGLYVFAAPWTTFTHDYVTLLRVVVCAVQAVAGALLYPLIVKAWGDRVAAVTGVVLINLVPLQYGLLGNANLTNTFGEAVALAAVLSASLLPSAAGLPLIVFFFLAALAFLSHVSTFALLSVTLLALAVLYRVLGEPSLRRTAWAIAGVTIIAAILATVLYWGHFGDVYRDALRVRGNAATSQAQVQAPAATNSPAAQDVGLVTRITNALAFALGMIGWPILLCTLAGVWRGAVDGARDRASLAVLAWMVACLLFLGVAVMRVDAPFQRYAAEFFGRVLLATFPAAVALAARGVGWAWHQGTIGQIASAWLVGWAAVLGAQNWAVWFL